MKAGALLLTSIFVLATLVACTADTEGSEPDAVADEEQNTSDWQRVVGAWRADPVPANEDDHHTQRFKAVVFEDVRSGTGREFIRAHFGETRRGGRYFVTARSITFHHLADDGRYLPERWSYLLEEDAQGKKLSLLGGRGTRPLVVLRPVASYCLPGAEVATDCAAQHIAGACASPSGYTCVDSTCQATCP
jgi:hypothetical protein